MKTKDLPPKSPTKVKGGKIAINDNNTLERVPPKPKVQTVRDLDPKTPSTVKGGVRMPSDDGGEVQAPPTPR